MILLPIGVDRPLIRIPWVTNGVIAANVIVYLALQLTETHAGAVYRFGFVPGHESLLTLFTYMFIHGDVLHLVGNIFFFLAAGLKMEDTLGSLRFLLFYLGSGIAAALLHASLSTMPIPMIGASGAVAGVLGGFLIMFPFSNIRMLFLLIIYPFRFSMPAVVVLPLWLGRELTGLVMDQRAGGTSPVAFGAHVGGFLAGALWILGFVGWNRGDDLDRMAQQETAGPARPVHDYYRQGSG